MCEFAEWTEASVTEWHCTPLSFRMRKNRNFCLNDSVDRLHSQSHVGCFLYNEIRSRSGKGFDRS